MLLRFLTYLVRCRPVGKDDYSMLTAWLCSLGFTAASFVSVRWGVGLRSDTLPSWQENAIQVREAINSRQLPATHEAS